MAARTLTVRQLAQLRRLGDGVRHAAGERAAAIALAVSAARVYHDGGASYPELAKALGVEPLELRVWLDATTPKTRRLTSEGPRTLPNRGATSGAVLACTGDARPGRNDFASELAAIRTHIEPRFTLVERTMIEISELAPSVNTHRPAVVHLAAHSTGDSVFLTQNGAAAPTLPTQIVESLTAAEHRPRILVLNFCGSIALVRQLRRIVPAVICWPGAPTDEHARDLAALFYRGLAGGGTAAASMDAVLITLPGSGLTANQLPRLIGDGLITLV